MITIVGGTGNLGTALIPRLLARGLEVRVITRDRSHVSSQMPSSVEVAVADVRDRAALSQAIAGSTTVISAITGFGGRDAAGAPAIDRDGNRNLIAAASAGGAEHMILLSVAQASADHPIELFRMKFAAEQDLRSSGLAWTIIRPTAYMETWVGIVGGPLLATGKTRIFGAGNNPINFVSAQDVAGLVDLAVVEPGLRNRIVDVGGPANLTFNELTACFEATTGRSGEKSHAPLPMMRAMSVLLKPIKPILAAQMHASVVMDTRDMRFDGLAARRDFPTVASTSLEAMIARDYLPA
ncbi:MAG TPA: SDR family oxidoreductase [Candidatus Limnocylindrales bacterium]|jgi:uncharacterized protein YbjT (DUF2867 family)